MGAATATDPTMASLALLDEPGRWHVVKAVPVFCAHRRKKRVKDKDGQEQEREIVVTEDDLHEIASNARSLERDRAVIPGLWLGHRNPDPNYPETKQPSLVGFSRNWRVGKWGPKKQTGLLVDLYYDRRWWDTADDKSYPYRSAEFYEMSDEITGVALLKRDPQLDLGMILNAREGRPIFYAADPTAPPAKPPLKDMDDDGDIDNRDAALDDDGDGELDPEDRQFMDRMRRCMKHPSMQKYLSAMGPSNADLPTPIKKKAGLDRDRDRDTASDLLQRQESHERYSRLEQEIAQLKKTNRQLQSVQAEQAEHFARNETALILENLEHKGVVLGGPDKKHRTFERMVKMSRADRLDYAQEMEESWSRTPVGGSFLDTSPDPDSYLRTAGSRDDAGESFMDPPRHHNDAMLYMRAHPGMTYEQAVVHVSGNGKAK